MSDDAALPQVMRQLLESRAAASAAKARQAKAEKAKDKALVAKATAGVPARPQDLPEEVTRLAMTARRTYLALLCEDAVVANLREALSKSRGKELKDVFDAVRAITFPEGEGVDHGPISLHFHNRVPRPPGSRTVDVSPP